MPYIYIYMPIYIYTYIYIYAYIYVHSMVSIRHVWYHFVNLHIQLFLWHQPETYLRSFEICLKEKQQDSSIFSTQRFIWTYITSTVSFMTCFHPFPLLNMTWMTSAFHRRSWINWVCNTERTCVLIAFGFIPPKGPAVPTSLQLWCSCHCESLTKSLCLFWYSRQHLSTWNQSPKNCRTVEEKK